MKLNIASDEKFVDDLTGHALDPALCRAARKKDMDSVPGGFGEEDCAGMLESNPSLAGHGPMALQVTEKREVALAGMLTEGEEAEA